MCTLRASSFLSATTSSSSHIILLYFFRQPALLSVVSMNSKPNVLVTGVSTGIGYSLVEVLVAEGYHVFGSVRKQADADRLAATFGNSFTPLLFDVTDEAAVKHAAEQARASLQDRVVENRNEVL